MNNPFRYRPPEAKLDHDMGEEGTEETDWEDTALSNSLAWASATFVPNWCQTKQHWTQRFADQLFTTCPCCMIFRGITIGAIGASAVWFVLLVLITIVS